MLNSIEPPLWTVFVVLQDIISEMAPMVVLQGRNSQKVHTQLKENLGVRNKIL